jgi:hypothetical protein
MRAVRWMVIGSLASALLIVAAVGREAGKEIVLGMLAPLAAAGVSWVLTERTYARSPERLTGLMISGFAAKMVFFGVYVAVMLKLVGLHPVPFVASFTGYFIALYLIEALLMRRLFAGG